MDTYHEIAKLTEEARKLATRHNRAARKGPLTTEDKANYKRIGDICDEIQALEDQG